MDSRPLIIGQIGSFPLQVGSYGFEPVRGHSRPRRPQRRAAAPRGRRFARVFAGALLQRRADAARC